MTERGGRAFIVGGSRRCRGCAVGSGDCGELSSGRSPQITREACVAIFDGRDTHTWPPALSAPPSWAAAYAKLASEHAVPTADLDRAVRAVQSFIDAIDAAAAAVQKP